MRIVDHRANSGGAPIGFHLMIRLADSRVIAPTKAAWRSVAVSFLTVGTPFELLVFRAADTHIHAVVAAGRERAGEFARRVEISMQRRLQPGVGFSEVHRKPIVDQSHLVNSVWYTLRNATAHGAAIDPLFEASNLPDLLGLRVLGDWTRRTCRRHLPRLDRTTLENLLPVRGGSATWDLRLLRDATSAAIGFPSGELRGPAPSRRQRGLGRAGVVGAAHLVTNQPAHVLATHLGVSRNTVDRARREEPRPELMHAIGGQLGLRSAWSVVETARSA